MAVPETESGKGKENCEVIEGKNPNGFSAASLSLRVQKKLAGRFSSRTVAKQFVSEGGARLFDSIYEILKHHYTKKEAEKTVKNMIKLAVKLGLVARAGNLNISEERLLVTAQQKVHTLALTLVSFTKVAYSYDRVYLLQLSSEVRKALEPVVDLHLSDKSGKRLEYVFEHLCQPALLDSIFKINGPHAEVLKKINSDLELLIDANDL